MKCEQFLGLQKKLNQPQRSIIQVKNKGSDTDAYLITIPTLGWTWSERITTKF